MLSRALLAYHAPRKRSAAPEVDRLVPMFPRISVETFVLDLPSRSGESAITGLNTGSCLPTLTNVASMTTATFIQVARLAFFGLASVPL